MPRECNGSSRTILDIPIPQAVKTPAPIKEPHGHLVGLNPIWWHGPWRIQDKYEFVIIIIEVSLGHNV